MSTTKSSKLKMTKDEKITLLEWELRMREEGYVAPFPEELMLNYIRKIRKEAKNDYPNK